MPLSAGSRLGPYEILTSLGAGGMGEVYKARDPRLNRFIAIKLLPGPAATDPDRRERFEREAHAIAALNHPNIVTIHSIEDIDGRSILTMELVEGRSLADAIPRGGLALDTLLKIAISVADAVAAAHQKGITHRDLKPANIMLGQGEHEGRVKVLDFGLAKLTAATTEPVGATTLATAPFKGAAGRLVTGEGRILGTVAYMSPEQAEGKTIDARSDLFSLGIILYEMATGHRPFTGDTSISIISSIVKDTPKSITEVKSTLPSELGRIVRHALTKDPERRYQSAKELRNDLEELKRLLDSGELQTQGAGSVATSRASEARVWRWAALGIALVSIVAIAGVVMLGRRRPQSTAAPTTPQIEVIRLTSSGNARLPALSPDGKFVTYVQEENDQQSVWVRQIGSNSNVRVVAPTPETEIRGLTVTPDGSFVDFVRWERNRSQALWRVPLLGGAVRKLVDAAASAPAWSPDGKQMAFLTSTSAAVGEYHVVVAEADGLRPRVIATRKLPRRYWTVTMASRPDLRPVWLPDGLSIAVVGSDTPQIANLKLLTVNVATGAETTLLNLDGYGLTSGMSMAVARDGRSFFLNKGEPNGSQQLVRLQLPGGDTIKLTNDLNEYAGASLAGDAVVTARRDTRSSVWLVDAAGNGARQIGQDIPSRLGGLAWAAGGRVIYFATLAGGAGLWSTDAAGGAPELIVPDSSFFFSTSRDGRTLVYTRRRDNKSELWRSDADGTHATQVATGGFTAATLTPDGSAVFYLSSQTGVQSVWTIDLHGGAPRQFAPVFVSGNGGIAFSPDGRFVMLPSRDEKTRAPETLIVPISGGEPVRRLSRDGFSHWTPDGRGLAYVDPSGLNVWVQPLDGGAPRQVTRFTEGQRIVEFGWSLDGTQLALTRAISTSDIVMLKGIR